MALKIVDLAECLVSLKKFLGEAMIAAGNDTEAEISLDCAPVRDALSKIAADIELEGPKTSAEIHGTGGRPTKDGSGVNRNDQEVATGDRRASDKHLAFDKRGNPSRGIDAIFASDNGSRVTAKHSVDSVFGESDRGNRDHDIDGIFGG